MTSEHVCYFRGDSRSTAELVADKTICSTCTLYLIRRYMMFAHATMKALCLLAVGVIIGTAISLFFRSRRAQSKARGEEGDGLVKGELSDGLVKGGGAAGPSWWDGVVDSTKKGLGGAGAAAGKCINRVFI